MRSLLILALPVLAAAAADGPAPLGGSPTVATLLRRSPELSAFTAALEESGLLDRLESGGPFTLFAPLDAGLDDAAKARIAAAPGRYVVAGNHAEAKPGRLQALTGDEVEITVEDEEARAGGASVRKEALVATNGVFHRVSGIPAPAPIPLEAPLPEGFPAPGPAEEVALKAYPRYRAARAEGGQGAFWTLFSQIQRNEIAMTAPVEMSMQEAGDLFTMTDMAFLYETPSLGDAGRDGLDRAGGWRLLGYHSPMVPSARP